MFSLTKKESPSFCPDTFSQMCTDAYIDLLKVIIPCPLRDDFPVNVPNPNPMIEFQGKVWLAITNDIIEMCINGKEWFSVDMEPTSFPYEPEDMAKAVSRIVLQALKYEHQYAPLCPDAFLTKNHVYRLFNPTIRHEYNEETNMVTVWVS